jgi:hypothetical protein
LPASGNRKKKREPTAEELEEQRKIEEQLRDEAQEYKEYNKKKLD